MIQVVADAFFQVCTALKYNQFISEIQIFSEPNRPDQSDLDPELAAIEHVKLQELYPDKVMVSPATANYDTEWMDQFWQHCQNLGCRIDYLATHCYTGECISY